MFVRFRSLTTLLTAAAVLLHLLGGCCRFSAESCCAGESAAMHEAEHEHDCGREHDFAHYLEDEHDHDAPHPAPCRGHCERTCFFSATMTESTTAKISVDSHRLHAAVVNSVSVGTVSIVRPAQPPPDPGRGIGLPVYLCALRI